MINFPRKYCLLIVILLLSLNAHSIEYRWLERLLTPDQSYSDITTRQQEWLDKQDTKRDEYLSSLKEVSIEKKIEEYWAKDKVIQRVDLNNNEYISIELVDESRETIVVKRDKKTNEINKVIIDKAYNSPLSDYDIFSNYTIKDIQLSPSKDYLLVSIYQNRTTTINDLLIFNLKSLDSPAYSIKYIHSSTTDLSWKSSDSFFYRDAKAGYYFEVDLKTGLRYFDPNAFPEFEAIEGTSYQYSFEEQYSEEGSKYFLIIKKFNSDNIIRNDITHLKESDEYYLSLYPRIKTKKSIIFADSSRMVTKLYVLTYKENEQNGIEIKTSNTFKAPDNGTIQKVFTLGEYYLAVFLSGVDKKYFIIDSNGELLMSLNAPTARLTKIKKLTGGDYEFNYESEVHEKKTIKININDLESWDSHSIDELLYTDLEGTKYQTVSITANSLDNTKIPVRIVYRSDLKISTKTPLYLQAYGGHGRVSYILPRYDFSRHYFLKKNGVYATPAIRGGGEFGESWYTQVFGSLVRYEDTESAIKELHKQGYGSPITTAFEGWSNGGLLAGVMLTRNPELFKLIISGNGLHDMERHEVLEGPFNWSNEFGNSRDIPSIEYLRSYSPVYNAKVKREYPVAYTMVGDYDKRVNPSQSYKLTAVLQDYQIGNNPIILDRYSDSGHWIDYPEHTNDQAIKALKRKWRVIFNELKVED